MTIRNELPPIFVMIAAAVSTVGCASPTSGAQPDKAKAGNQAGPAASSAPRRRPTLGPFEVAQQWAAQFRRPTTADDDDVDAAVADMPPPVQTVVRRWSSARVARVWAVNGSYRALVVQKNTAQETPAVLLVLSADGQDGWTIDDLSPTTSTLLWSEL